jgi:ubiquinone/menaquinone biosynthesis C-methylase UbiE
MEKQNHVYIPALNREWLTPLYDPFLRLVMQEYVFKQQLINLAGPKPGERILDLGCGTGTLTLMIQKSQPRARITALDGDEKVLAIARRKALSAGMQSIRWDRGLAYDLPYPDMSFDLVFSSLVIHHLSLPDKQKTFREVKRTLRPGGRFFIADFGPAHDPLMKLATLYMSLFEETRENFQGLIPEFLIDAGFEQVIERDHFRRIFGPLSIYQAYREA